MTKLSGLFLLLGVVFNAHADTTIYMSPAGSDSADGSSAGSSVRSLSRVKDLVAQALNKAGGDIRVEMAPGTYAGNSVVWDLAAKKTRITFAGSKSEQSPTVFDGSTARGSFFVVRPADSEPSPIRTNLSFEHFTVRNYCEGMSFGGYGTEQTVMDNRVSHVNFESIGSKHESKNVDGERGNCLAAVRAQRATNIELTDLTFINIENLPKKQTQSKRYGPTLLHAIYIAERSSNIKIANSRFNGFTGSPVRIRDRSSKIEVVNNIFRRPIFADPSDREEIELAAISQWNCTAAIGACLSKRPECPSQNVVVKGNKVEKGLTLYKDMSNGNKYTCRDPQIVEAYKAGKEGYAVQLINNETVEVTKERR
jgi:hypothetical protein